MKQLSSGRVSATEQKIRDRFIYLAIALVIAGAAVTLGVYDADHEIKSDTQIQWITAGVFTLVVFGFIVSDNRKLWHIPKALLLLVTLLSIHVLGAIWTVNNVLATQPGKLPLVLYVVISLLEIAIFNVILRRVFSGRRSN